jgi:hypothetical protein
MNNEQNYYNSKSKRELENLLIYYENVLRENQETILMINQALGDKDD